jgi:hypothetical protein
MFMLTHTYFLQKVLAAADTKNTDLDAFVYNIAPDLLTIHPEISPDKTHRVQRSLKVPGKYSKSAYVIFHLLVDDLCHYGYVCSEYKDKFDSDSKGYCYIKGQYLTDAISDIYRMIKKEISYDEAVYQAHLIIEMIYDIVIVDNINSMNTIDLLVEAINFTRKNRMHEFVETINWLYGFEKSYISEVMENAASYITKDRMKGIMNLEGRIKLYKAKFSLYSDEPLFYEGLKKIFQHALNLIDDDELFFREIARMVENQKWMPVSS